MKFTEAQLQQAFIHLLSEEGIPHVHGASIPRENSEVLIVEDLKNFGQFVVGKVRESFGDLFVQIIEYVYPDKDINAWKENLQVVQKDYIAE